jgi:cation:H+ antiporter
VRDEEPRDKDRLLYVVTLLIGLIMLVLGAEMIVRGGGQLAMALRVPALVVGLTIVAFGTSTPELCVSVTAAFSASTEMALSNVNGSNIANVLLVLGVASLVRPLQVERTLMRREIPSCMLLQLAVPLLCWDGVLSRVDGVLLICGGAFYNIWLLWEAMRGRPPPLEEFEVSEGRAASHLFMLAGGIGVLVLGSQLFVSGATELAQLLNWSDRFIGLTVVALGTSAPEVATGVVSAYRGETDLAVGNSLGSNLLNISMVLGITALVMPIEIHDAAVWTDFAIAMGVTMVLAPVVLKGSLTRFEGGLFTLAYVGFIFVGNAL